MTDPHLIKLKPYPKLTNSLFLKDCAKLHHELQTHPSSHLLSLSQPSESVSTLTLDELSKVIEKAGRFKLINRPAEYKFLLSECFKSTE